MERRIGLVQVARLPALVDAFCEIDERPRGSIDHVARVVREAGLIQTTKRGRGAADMTAEDAAWLLLGLYSIGQASDAAIAARLYAALPAVSLRQAPTDSGPADAPPHLEVFRPGMPLIKAITSVIEMAPLLASTTPLTRAAMHFEAWHHGAAWPQGISALLTIRRPNPTAELTFAWKGERNGAAVVNQSFLFQRRGSRSSPAAQKPTDFISLIHSGAFSVLHQALFPSSAREQAPPGDLRGK